MNATISGLPRPGETVRGLHAAETAPPAPAPSRPPDTAPLHDARALTGPGREARILLDGQLYTLRITRAGKLILTK